jgi:hypothetical protein
MKRLLYAWVICSVFSLGSFGVLLLQDQRLGIMLPYSVPLAFAAILALTPVLLALASRIPVREAPPSESRRALHDPPASPTPVRISTPEGIVLLDFSSASKKRAA